jgi:polysaccharide pyruvyl transferase CsaB
MARPANRASSPFDEGSYIFALRWLLVLESNVMDAARDPSAPARPRRILFSGYFGGGNLGDEALLSAELGRFRVALRGQLEPVVVTLDPALTRRLHGEIETVPFQDVKALSLAIAQSDLVVWGGGGLLQDHWHVPVEELFLDPLGGVPAYLRVPLLAAAWGRPCMVYGQGVGPLSVPENRRLVGLALSGVDVITVRDAASADLLRECGVTGRPILTTADPVVSIRPSPAERGLELIAGTGLDPSRRPIIAVAPRVPPNGDVSWVGPFCAALKDFGREAGAAALFVPFDQEKGSDTETCRELATRCSSSLPVGILSGWLSPEDVAACLGQCDLTIATRLHGLYLSVLTGTPVIALDYDPKVRVAAGEFGPDIPVLSLDGLDERGLTLALAKTLADAPALRPRLLAALESLRRRETGNIEHALALLSGRVERGAQERTRWLLDELSRARSESQLLQTEKGELEARCLDLGSQRDELIGERATLERELNTLKGSRGVRLIMGYWSLANRLLPHGGPLSPLRRLLHGRREDAAPETRERQEALPDSSDPGAPRPVEPTRPAPGPSDPFLDFDALLGERPGEKKGLVVLTSGTFLDVDEGQRPTQLALQLAAQGYVVVFVYWRWTREEWRPQDHLDRGIVQIPVDLVLERFPHVFQDSPFRHRHFLLCFPHAGFFEPIAMARARGWTVAYDVMDDWMEFSRVGQAIWYDEAFERHLLGTADAVFAVNESLARHLETLGCKAPVVVPNGVSPAIADVDEERPLEKGVVTVGYFGYLAGAWFDWDLVAGAARSRPDWKFYLIGYGGGPEGLELPANLVLLGKKPQKQLAGFARNWDVGIVPFRAERLAAGADPIKTYEYLAMGLPVVTTGVFPPPGAEHLVKRAADSGEFLTLIEQGAWAKERGRGERIAFAGNCTWKTRTLRILRELEGPLNERVKLQAALFGNSR